MSATMDDYADLPESMRNAQRWLVWRSQPNGQKKPRKVPYYVNGSPRNGELDSPADLARLATLEDAALVM